MKVKKTYWLEGMVELAWEELRGEEVPLEGELDWMQLLLGAEGLLRRGGFPAVLLLFFAAADKFGLNFLF